ncbi:MAG TPA: hypothetical protein PK109_00405 [Candidatus Paceibacterota bacterium]|nr:hypothetical protein [Candidatus Paceibacterota bacterium]
MSETVPHQRVNRAEEFEEARAAGFRPLSDYIAAIGNRAGARVSDMNVRKFLKMTLGIPAESTSADIEALIPANHPLRSHLRFPDGKLFFDQYLFMRVLETLSREWKDHPQTTVRSTVRKLAPYLENLKKELGVE